MDTVTKGQKEAKIRRIESPDELLDLPELDVSATQLRKHLAEQANLALADAAAKPHGFLSNLHPDVLRYIAQHRLYTQPHDLNRMTDTTSATAKKDVLTLQRIVIDALEDVKAVDLVLFNTEHLSSLFERVVIASGSSNRQTRALAASVRDQVRDAGYSKPRVEGEGNGEWIVVDCGSVVVHVMQPAIRAYYHLEDIWGDTPVRLKPVAAEKAAAKREKIADSKKNPAVVTESIDADAPKKVVKRSAAKAAPEVAEKAAPTKSSRRPAPTKADVAAKKAAVKRAVKAAAPKPAPQIIPKVKHVSATKAGMKATLEANKAEKAAAPRKSSAAPIKAPALRAAVPAKKAIGVKRAGPVRKTAK